MTSAFWSDQQFEMLRTMFAAGASDSEILSAINQLGPARTHDGLKRQRARLGLLRSEGKPMRKKIKRVMKDDLTHEQRVACDERFVDAMIVAGYLPSDPKLLNDGAAASYYRAHPPQIFQGSSWGFE